MSQPNIYPKVRRVSPASLGLNACRSLERLREQRSRLRVRQSPQIEKALHRPHVTNASTVPSSPETARLTCRHHQTDRNHLRCTSGFRSRKSCPQHSSLFLCVSVQWKGPGRCFVPRKPAWPTGGGVLESCVHLGDGQRLRRMLLSCVVGNVGFSIPHGGGGGDDYMYCICCASDCDVGGEHQLGMVKTSVYQWVL